MKPRISGRWRRWAPLLLLVIGLVVGQSWVTYHLFAVRFPGGNDFAARWFNGCSLIWTGANPYSDAVTTNTQIQMYGRPALPGEDLVAFSYPLYALFLFWPLCFVQPYALVQAIWMTLMLYGVIFGTLLMMRTSGLKVGGALLIVTLLWTVINYPHARAVLLGQMVVLVFVTVGLTLSALQHRADFWAGVALAAATIKPQVTILLVIWLLWWSAWQRRWRFWWGFAAAMALMGGIGLLLIPTWPLDFVRDLLYYDKVTVSPYHSLTWMVVRHFFNLGLGVEVMATSALALYLLHEWWRCRNATGETMLWVTGLTLNLTLFMAVQIATTSYLLLLLPIFLLFRLAQRQAPERATLITLAAQACMLVSQWVLFLATVEGRLETAWVYLLVPIGLLVAQMSTRPRRSAGIPR